MHGIISISLAIAVSLFLYVSPLKKASHFTYQLSEANPPSPLTCFFLRVLRPLTDVRIKHLQHPNLHGACAAERKPILVLFLFLKLGWISWALLLGSSWKQINVGSPSFWAGLSCHLTGVSSALSGEYSEILAGILHCSNTPLFQIFHITNANPNVWSSQRQNRNL